VGQWESGQFPKIYNSIIMDLHIKLEHNLVHKIIRLISKGYILIMYPCVAFVVALLIALLVVAAGAGATVATVSVPPVAAVAAGAGVAVATSVASTAVAAVAVGVHYQH
jgi:Na+-transporting methylmalonyl-CoA/oxaloacetate decarboxylase gamma subunit